jgi:hypothetical protein
MAARNNGNGTVIARWRKDPVAFISEVLVDPETGEPFRLYPEQITFLRHAFELTPEGRMRYTELCFSAGKKSGKTGLGAMIVIFTAVCLAGVGGEIYLLANDFEQSVSRVFKAVVLILQASPLLKRSADITNNKITFRATGTTIMAVANDFSDKYPATRGLSIRASVVLAPRVLPKAAQLQHFLKTKIHSMPMLRRPKDRPRRFLVQPLRTVLTITIGQLRRRKSDPA